MTTDRAIRIADAGLRILTEHGMRGLTHRAVDTAAGLPSGSTSNLARTRSALLRLVFDRLDTLDAARFAEFEAAPPPGTADELAAATATALHVLCTRDRARMVARYELALEATRDPGLRRIYDAGGRRSRALATRMLAAAGCPDPVSRAGLLVAVMDGVMFDAIAGAGTEPSEAELRSALGDVIAGWW